MERAIIINIERLSEGLWLATSDDIRGLVAQGQTIGETTEIAHDVAKKLIEMQGGSPADLRLAPKFTPRKPPPA